MVWLKWAVARCKTSLGGKTTKTGNDYYGLSEPEWDVFSPFADWFSMIKLPYIVLIRFRKIL